jgi:DNA-binding protein HU-beta
VNKTELIDAIATDSGLSRTDSARSLDSLITTVQKTLKKGDDVAITGFGKFSVTRRGARTGRNPATGEAIKIKASKAPKFTAGQTLNTAVANKKKA